MSILKTLGAQWSAMSTAEKVKFVLGLMVQTGSAVIGGDIAARSAAGKKPLTRACVAVAGIGLGAAIGEAANKPIEETVDLTAEFIKMRKEQKEEGTKNA